MQARVEPQFLFNTLAQVRELYEHDVGVAGRMLDDLTAYLRAALPHLRHSTSPLGQEIALVQAYLDIVRVRLGDRLRFDVDVPDAAKSFRVPPMMLLPLIDPLVRGLKPDGAGGSIRIVNEAAAAHLLVSLCPHHRRYSTARPGKNIHTTTLPPTSLVCHHAPCT